MVDVVEAAEADQTSQLDKCDMGQAIKVILLGRLTDLADQSELVIDLGTLGQAGKGAMLQDTAQKSGQAMDWQALCDQIRAMGFADLAEAICSDQVKLAQNGRLLADKYGLQAQAGDEIALLPPVSGG